MTRASKALLWPAATSAATLPSCVALCASIGCADDVADREDVRHVGAHLLVDRDEATLVDVARRRLGADRAAVRHAPDRDQHAVEGLRRRRLLALEAAPAARRARPRCPSPWCRAGSARSGRGCASRAGAPGRGSQPGIRLGGQFDDADARAERIVDAGHLQTDDAAADHQQAAGELRQLERAGRIDDARIVGQARQPHRLGAGGDDALLEADAFGAAGAASPPARSGRRSARAAHDLDLALLGEHRESAGQLADDLRSSRRAASRRSICGAPKATPRSAISSASSMTLAACSSALEGMQPTFRHTPPSVAPALDQRHLEAEVGGAEGGGVAARAGTEHQRAATRARRTPSLARAARPRRRARACAPCRRRRRLRRAAAASAPAAPAAARRGGGRRPRHRAAAHARDQRALGRPCRRASTSTSRHDARRRSPARPSSPCRSRA